MTLHLVNCRDYNGHKNVLFCMETSDPRFTSDNWEDFGPITKVGRRWVCEKGHVYDRFEDWSMRKVSIS